MKILLVGEYSNVHNNLAEGLRALGHEVITANDGNGWKKFHSDIDLHRELSFWGRISYMYRLLRALPKMRGYDVVQLINPHCLQLKAGYVIPFIKYLRRNNKKLVVCALGEDYYYCYMHRKYRPQRYSDYNIGDKEIITDFARGQYNECVGTDKETLTKVAISECDAIVSAIHEYWKPYDMVTDKDAFGQPIREKNHFIPLPIKVPNKLVDAGLSEKLRVFIGIQKGRSEYKGTDIMLKAANDLKQKYPDRMEIKIAENVPFAEYKSMMDNSDVMLDQVYSYGPGMNALLALSKGIICLTGGEPENYDLMGEEECRPIVNVTPFYDVVYSQLEKLILMPKQELQELKRQSHEYVVRNHDSKKVAKQYEALYNSLRAK